MEPRLTLAEVFRTHAKEFVAKYDTRLVSHQRQAIWAISNCRTEAMGHTIVECNKCGHKEQHYNSCRHRGCPECEGAKDAEWMAARQSELLPVHYFHVVFTIPHVLNELFLNNPKECFDLLFRAVSKTILTVGGNKLDAKLGFFSILHTWGQLLTFHPHIHCVIPGGGIKADGSWVSSSKRSRYFASTKVLSSVFEGILLKALRKAYKAQKIKYQGNFEQLISLSLKSKWVVHAKAPFGSAMHVIKYLSRYTRKVAISNSRLIKLKDGKVTFSYKDYSEGALKKLSTLNALEFMRRFLMHIPVPGFVRIRYYGFMAGKDRKDRLVALRETILGLLPLIVKLPKSNDSLNPNKCTLCSLGTMLVVLLIKRAIRRDSS